MQTFLPYPDIAKSVQVLDMRRLGKQRVEAHQILNVFTNQTTTKGWRNHPATKMWEGYEETLGFYMNACIDEWKSRGYKNTMKYYPTASLSKMPTWFGGQIHTTHRSNLLRKDKQYYGKFNWSEPDNLPYYWPSHAVIHETF